MEFNNHIVVTTAATTLNKNKETPTKLNMEEVLKALALEEEGGEGMEKEEGGRGQLTVPLYDSDQYHCPGDCQGS